MNLKNLHLNEKEVSATNLFKGQLGTATAIQLRKYGTLKEHLTKTPAMLICLSGRVTYKDETGNEIELESGDYVEIQVNIKHWLYAAEQTQLILLK